MRPNDLLSNRYDSATFSGLESSITSLVGRRVLLAANSATVTGSELKHNTIGLFAGTGTTVRLARMTIAQNSTNDGSIITLCNNESESNTIPCSFTQNRIK